MGGGFGAAGAIEGMAIASVLNSLTTSRRNWVSIELIGDDGWVRVQLNGADTLVVRDQLRLLADSVVSRRSERSEQPKASNPELDLVASLERLVKLRDAHALTDEEFQLAKEKLLGAP
jgi:hypothetical protein